MQDVRDALECRLVRSDRAVAVSGSPAIQPALDERQHTTLVRGSSSFRSPSFVMAARPSDPFLRQAGRQAGRVASRTVCRAGCLRSVAGPLPRALGRKSTATQRAPQGVRCASHRPIHGHILLAFPDLCAM